MKLDPEALGRRIGDLRVGWLLAGWLVATLAIALNRGIGLLWGMVWLLAAALLVGTLLPFLQVRGVRVRRELPTIATAGEPVEIRYTLETGARPRYALELLDRLGGDHVPRLAGFVERVRRGELVRLAWTPPVRGRRVFDAIVLQSRFPLGVAVARRTQDAPRQEVLVYPQAVPLRRLPVEQGSDVAIEHTTSRAPHGRDEYAGVRPYRPGDEPRNVHWRGTARSGDLVVREFDRAADREFWIVLELALGEHRLAGRDGTFEMMFRIAHSALQRAQADGLPTGLVYRTRGRIETVPAGRDRATVTRIREALALVEGDDGAPLAAWMARDPRALPRGGTWLVFAGDDAQCAALAAVCRARAARPLTVRFERTTFGPAAAAAPKVSAGAHPRDGGWIAPAFRGMDLRELF